MLAHQGEDSVIEPGVVAELDSRTRAGRNAPQEQSKTVFILLQVPRKLEEYRPEFASRYQWLGRVEKAFDVGFDSLKSLQVGDALVRLEGEAEPVGSGF